MFSELTGNREEGPLDDKSSRCSFDQIAPVLPVQSSSDDMKSYYLLYFMLFVSCFFSNGFLTAISTYISMPYGSQAYHLSAVLSTLANPIACVIATFRPLKSERGIILSIFISLVRFLRFQKKTDQFVVTYKIIKNIYKRSEEESFASKFIIFFANLRFLLNPLCSDS